MEALFKTFFDFIAECLLIGIKGFIGLFLIERFLKGTLAFFKKLNKRLEYNIPKEQTSNEKTPHNEIIN